MMVLITYDVETVSPSGRKRLQRISKICKNYGQRVQNSVFECVVDPSQFQTLKYQIEKIIDKKKDSVRYYFLGSHWTGKIEHVGAKPGYNPENDCLII